MSEIAMFRQLTWRDTLPRCIDMTPDAIYPYIIREEYLRYQADAPQLVKPLGHSTHVTLVEDVGGAVKSLKSEDLNTISLTPTQAYERAIENLENLLMSGVIQMQLFAQGPDGKPFILVGSHWAAAACILLPNLPNLARNSLHTDEICLSIPHREALLIFAKEDRAYRDRMRAMIEEMEGNPAKPLTPGLFTFRADVPVALSE
jgi:hypothetical protein